MIEDNAKIADDSYLPPDTVVPPFTYFGGKPAVFLAEMPESTPLIQKEEAISIYKAFQPDKAVPKLQKQGTFALKETPKPGV